MISNIGGCRAQQTPVEGLNRLREASSQWEELQSVMVRGKNEYLKALVRTGNDKFVFIGCSSMP